MGGRREEEREEMKGKEGGGRRVRKPLYAKCMTFNIMTVQHKMKLLWLAKPYSMTTLTFDQGDLTQHRKSFDRLLIILCILYLSLCV